MEKTNRKSRRTGKWAIIVTLACIFFASPILVIGAANNGITPYTGYQTELVYGGNELLFDMGKHSSMVMSFTLKQGGASHMAFSIDASIRTNMKKYSQLISPQGVTSEYVFDTKDHWTSDDIPCNKQGVCPRIRVQMDGGGPVILKLLSVTAK